MSSVLTELGGGAVGESGVVAGDLLPVAGLLAALRDVHSTEAQPGGLLVKLVHLPGLPLVEEPHSLLSLLPETRNPLRYCALIGLDHALADASSLMP